VGTIGSGRRGESQASFVNSGTETSKVYKSDPTTQIGFTAFRSTPLKSARRLVGSGTLAFVGTCSLPRGQLAVTLFDTAKDGTTKVITLGLLDLRFRRSLASAEAVPTGEFTAVVTLRPQDYVVAAGHRIVLTVAGSDSVWGVPDPVAGQQITVSGDSVLSLPLVGAGAVVE
jgi:X-Pro dipeptidyl-peptidase